MVRQNLGRKLKIFEKGKIKLKEELMKKLSENSEVKVTLGEWIGNTIN